MKVVPLYDQRQVGVAAPEARASNPLSPGMAARGGQTIEDAGNALAQAGASVGNTYLDHLNDVNATVTNDGLNRLSAVSLALRHTDKGTGFLDQRGPAAMPKDGKTLSDTYGAEFDKASSDIFNSLTSDDQRQVFKLRSAQLRQNFLADVQAHEVREYETYKASTFDAGAQVAADTVLTSVKDPDTTRAALATLSGYVRDRATLDGMSESAAEVLAQQKTSAALRPVVQDLIDKGNLPAAQAYMDTWGGKGGDHDWFTAADKAALFSQLQDAASDQQALSAADTASRKLSTSFSADELTRAENILVDTESGGRHASEGKITVSPAGAYGKWQVWEPTGPEAARLAGLKWDPALFKDPGPEGERYNEALGRAYFRKQIATFNGDLAKAYAAYNGGPGHVREAEKLASAAGRPGDWLSFIPQTSAKDPAQIVNYVEKNMGLFNAGGGTPNPPTKDDYVNAARASLPADAAPKTVEKAMTLASQAYERDADSAKQRQDAAYNAALNGIIGGAHFYDLPVSVRSALPAKQQKELIDYDQQLAKGPVESNLAVYQDLSNDARLKAYTDDDFFKLRTQLTPGDWKKFADHRAELLDPTKTTNTPQNVDMSSVNAALDNRLHQINIATTGRLADPQRLGAIRKTAVDSILRAQQIAGHRFSDAEINAHLDTLFLKSVTFNSTLFGMSVGAPSHVRVLGMTVHDIPADDRDRLKKAFKQHGIDNPTDGDLLMAYMEAKAGLTNGR